MEEEYVDVELRLDDEVVKHVKSMTKKELINKIFNVALEAKLTSDKLEKAERDYAMMDGSYQNQIKSRENDIDILQTKLDTAEAYVEQGRAMITSVMNRWYEYDT